MSGTDHCTTGEVAKLLGVSPSTVRRWADGGELACVKNPASGYRRFDRTAVLAYRERLFHARENVPPAPGAPGNVPPEPHPAHYLMHKYWGRKPHNVIRSYIEAYTRPGETVLDPFMGSGITVVEALKAGRRCIGLDLNPMSRFIVENTVSQVDLDRYSEAFRALYQYEWEAYRWMYETRCPHCGAASQLETLVWDRGEPRRVRGRCPEHGLFLADASLYDMALVARCRELRRRLDAEGRLSYPTDPILQYVRRSGRERVDELFTDRALILLSDLRQNILCIHDAGVRDLLLFTFSSMLSNVSRMIPGDLEKCTYKSGWVISKFWTPKVHTERSIFSCFQLRYRAILSGKAELRSLETSGAALYTRDACDLGFIPDGSVDYILTDPPYGESIAYLALSQFWNAWLFPDVDYAGEIIIDPYRDKRQADYEAGIRRAFHECYRVLRPGRTLSFTFNNRDLAVWRAVVEGCVDAGFELMSIVLQDQAVSSGTQGINRNNTLTGDFVYSFYKPLPGERAEHRRRPVDDAAGYLLGELRRYIRLNGSATPTEIYEYIIPIVARERLFSAPDGSALSIEKLLQEHFSYVENTAAEGGIGRAYIWVAR